MQNMESILNIIKEGIIREVRVGEISQQILFISDLEKMIGRDRMTLRRWWMDGKFPKPVKLNDRTLAWHVHSINEWVSQYIKVNVNFELMD